MQYNTSIAIKCGSRRRLTWERCIHKAVHSSKFLSSMHQYAPAVVPAPLQFGVFHTHRPFFLRELRPLCLYRGSGTYSRRVDLIVYLRHFFVSFSPDALVNVTHRQAPHSPLTDRDIRRLLRCLERLKYKLEFSWRKNPQHAPPKVVTPTRCLASCHSSVRGYLYRPPPSLWFAAKTQFHSCTL